MPVECLRRVLDKPACGTGLDSAYRRPRPNEPIGFPCPGVNGYRQRTISFVESLLLFGGQFNHDFLSKAIRRL